MHGATIKILCTLFIVWLLTVDLYVAENAVF